MIPCSRQDIAQAGIGAVVKVPRSDWLTQCPMAQCIEQAVVAYAGTEHAILKKVLA